ncbi:hypothetical protein B0E44_08615 [Flavobacterium sp. A45]|nr:hypothetical protein B0E44_08615 [Flavobacterium sp. A45]
MLNIDFYENVFFILLINSQKRGVLFEEKLVFLRNNKYYEIAIDKSLRKQLKNHRTPMNIKYCEINA